MWYFAYGSNLNSRAVAEWCRHFGHRPPPMKPGKPAVLDNYRLSFPIFSEYWGGGIADIVYDPGKYVGGAVFDLSDADLNILDQKVGRPNPDHFSYTAGKVALAGLTPALALALAPNIRVCGLSPGLTLPSGPQSEDDYAKGAAATPLGLTSSVDGLRRALRFILESEALTGQILTLDGGESLLLRDRDVAYDPSV